MNYEPLSKEILLERGYCCNNGCKNCPYKTENIMAKKFKPHMMYSKTGKGVKANTLKKHLELKKKGWGHTKPKNKK